MRKAGNQQAYPEMPASQQQLSRREQPATKRLPAYKQPAVISCINTSTARLRWPSPKTAIGIKVVQAIFNALSRLLWKHVPPLHQANDVECGATCLAMILRYYGSYVRIAEIHECYSSERDGLSALQLVQAANDYGLRVRAISLSIANLQNIPLPAIVHWEFNHFIVVEHWSPTQVMVVDPAIGRKRMTTAEFGAGFTGIMLLLEPGDTFYKRKISTQTTLRSYAGRYLKQSPALLIQVLVASALLQITGLGLPLLTKIIIDHIVPLSLTNMMPLIGIGIGILLLTQILITLLRQIVVVTLMTNIDIQMVSHFFTHMLYLPLRFFQQRSIGDLISRIESNAHIRDSMSSDAISAILDSGLVVISLAILFAQSLQFGLFLIAIGFLQTLILLVTTPTTRQLARSELEISGKLQGYETEILAGITTLKAAGAEQQALQQWSQHFFKQIRLSMKQSYLATAIDLCIGSLQFIASFFFLWIGTMQVLQGKMEIGTMLALAALAQVCLTPLTSLIHTITNIQLVRSHLERIADVMETETEQTNQASLPAPRLAGQITLDHVSFRYAQNAANVLHDITLHIQPGQKIAIVGKTGSGKSTLGKLLLGLYLPSEGEICYDGQPLRELNYQQVRAQFGVVMQDAMIFSGSIRHNITLQQPGITPEDMIAAAQGAALHDDIQAMPMGYETFVAEGGNALSGGQRQRLALARALAHRPAVLLLDEATSSLDVSTERCVEQNLAQLACTQIIIAHRLSTVRNADMIIVLDQGQLVESGTHEELLAQKGYYAALIENQLFLPPSEQSNTQQQQYALATSESA